MERVMPRLMMLVAFADWGTILLLGFETAPLKLESGLSGPPVLCCAKNPCSESRPVYCFALALDSRFVRRVRRCVGRFDTELLGVLGVQPLPAELHGLRADDASNGLIGEKPIQNIETNVPPRSTHCDEAVTDVGPQRQARAATQSFEFPPHIKATPLVLKHLESVGSRHGCFGNT